MKDKRPHVLVVEDDRELRESLAEVIVDEGFPVVMVANGAEALEYLRSHRAPGVILLDLMMPVMSGVEFRRRQLEDSAIKDIPVVLLTAAHDGQRQAKMLGVSECISKPLDLEKLIDVLSLFCSPVSSDSSWSDAVGDARGHAI